MQAERIFCLQFNLSTRILEHKLFKHQFLIIDIMGQQEVYSFLKRNRNKWFSSKEISKGLRVSLGSVMTSLKRLRESRAIDFRDGKRKNQFEYRFKK